MLGQIDDQTLSAALGAQHMREGGGLLNSFPAHQIYYTYAVLLQVTVFLYVRV